MISFSSDRPPKHSWQASFLKLLPQINQRLKHAFRSLDPASKDEAMQSAIVLCLCSYARLYARQRAHAASASTLVFYAVKQVKSGRPAGGRMNVREPLSLYAQLRRDIKVQPLHTFEPGTGTWIGDLVDSKRASVADVVAIRLDSRNWLATLSLRTRSIAADLAQGFSTSEVAGKYGVSAGRISQLRRELERSWHDFQHEGSMAHAG